VVFATRRRTLCLLCPRAVRPEAMSAATPSARLGLDPDGSGIPLQASFGLGAALAGHVGRSHSPGRAPLHQRECPRAGQHDALTPPRS